MHVVCRLKLPFQTILLCQWTTNGSILGFNFGSLLGDFAETVLQLVFHPQIVIEENGMIVLPPEGTAKELLG